MKEDKVHISKFLKNGDRDSFEFLYLKYEKDFKRYAALNLVSPGIDTDDLIQDTIVKILSNPPVGKKASGFNFKSYFGRSIHNTFIDQVRTVKRNRDIHWFYDEDALLKVIDIPYFEPNYGAFYLRMNELTLNQKRVLELRLQGYKYREISESMSICMNTVRGMFRYASLKLIEHREEILTGMII
jgi:RNA polymerase sigma factor (sigma-70 family)